MNQKDKRYKIPNPYIIVDYDEYNNVEKSIEEGITIIEKALNSDDIKKIKRLKKSSDISNILKSIDTLSNKIVTMLSEIDFNQIKLTIKTGNYIEVSYTKNINVELINLNDELSGVENKKIKDLFFKDGYDDLFLQIELDNDNLNKIDIINGLPNFIKNIGLGKKIYKKLIKDFGFISSFSGFKPSLDSDMVWKSIANDKEIFTFSNDDNLISFWNNLEYEFIIEKLKIFYNNKGSIQIDDDFISKFKLTKEEFLNVIKLK